MKHCEFDSLLHIEGSLSQHNLKNGSGNDWFDINPTLEWWTLYCNHSIFKKLADLVSL